MKKRNYLEVDYDTRQEKTQEREEDLSKMGGSCTFGGLHCNDSSCNDNKLSRYNPHCSG